MLKKNYPFLLWITTIFLAPVLYLILLSIKSGTKEGMDGLAYIMLFVIFGVFYSLPVPGIVYLLFLFLNKRLRSSIFLVIIIDVVTIGCTLVTFYLIGGTMMPELGLVYSAAVVLASLILQLKICKKLWYR